MSQCADFFWFKTFYIKRMNHIFIKSMGCASSSPVASSHQASQPCTGKPQESTTAPVIHQVVHPVAHQSHQSHQAHQAPFRSIDSRLIGCPQTLGDEVYNALAFPMLNLPGVIFHPRGRAIGVPVKGFYGLHSDIFLAIEVESGLDSHGRPLKHGPPFDFKLYQVFKPRQKSYWLDAMAHEGAGVGMGIGTKALRRPGPAIEALKVEFRNHVTYDETLKRDVGLPKRVLGGALDVRREIKINDKMMPFLPANVRFYLYPGVWANKRRLSIDTVVRAHGWSGVMSWPMCRHGATDSKGQWKGPLHDVWVDDSTEEIYMPLISANGDTYDAYLVVDFDDDNVDMKVIVPVRTPESPLPPFSYQWSLPSNPDCKIKGHVYDTPKQVSLKHLTATHDPRQPDPSRKKAHIGDTKTMLIKMMIQLDDVPFSTLFDQMILDPVALDFGRGCCVSADDTFPHLMSIIQQCQKNAKRTREGDAVQALVPVPALESVPAWSPTGFGHTHEVSFHHENETKVEEVQIRMVQPSAPPLSKTPQSAEDPIPVMIGDQASPPIQVHLGRQGTRV